MICFIIVVLLYYVASVEDSLGCSFDLIQSIPFTSIHVSSI